MSVRARVKSIFNSDMDELEASTPPNAENFCLSVRVMAGPEPGSGEESFDIQVCTPTWLAEACRREGFILGRHILIVNRFDVLYIKKVITELVEKCEGSSWRDAATKVARIGYWEFEDYK